MVDDSLLIVAIILAAMLAWLSGGPDYKLPPSEGHVVSVAPNAYK